MSQAVWLPLVKAWLAKHGVALDEEPAIICKAAGHTLLANHQETSIVLRWSAPMETLELFD